MPTGYPTVGTILRLNTIPVADALSVGFPSVTTGVTETTTLAGGFATNIPNNVINVSSFTVEVKNAASAIANFLAAMVAKTVQAFSLDFTDGDSMTGNAQLIGIAPAGANIGSPATDKFTLTFQPTGVLAVAATTGDWYAGVDGLSIIGGDVSMASGSAATALVVYAVASGGGFSFEASNALLDFVSSDPTKASVGANTGIVTPLAVGVTTIKASITGKATVEINVVVTVT
jgi:hypothetical protein